jgi:MarC family membrane protein
METQMTTLAAAIMLFLIMDPLGNIPIFLSLLKDVPPKRRRRVMVRELLIALGVLLGFLVGGQGLLNLLQLKSDSISIAGGIVLFLIGIRMVFPPADGGGIFGKSGGGEPFIVPMAIPGVAGPSAMAALLLLTNTQPGRTADWAIALVGAWLATAVILLCSTYLFRWLGESVLTALERVMGMLLIALSVQMFMAGVAAFLHLKL